nr:zinc finger, CCHC-type [Tanacetum cinerariifolium]
MDESIQVSCIIEKLPISWKDFKHNLKHLKDELTLVELGSHLCIKESLRTQDNDKPKGNNVVGPLVVNMVEHNNSFRYNDNRGKCKHHETKADPNKKLKVTCWKCGKLGHLKKDCKAGNGGNKANGPGTKCSVDGSSNSLKGATVHVCKDRCWFKTYESLNDRSILYMGNESTTLVHGRGCVDLRLNIISDNIGSAFMSTSKLNNSILWHARLGHVHFKRMQDMLKDGLISAFDIDTEKCKTCMLTKITKKSFQIVKCETKFLELIHSDLCDLHATPSLENKKYFVTFIDDSLRFCYVYILHSKDEALDKFKVFKTKVELQQRSLIKRFRTDTGDGKCGAQNTLCGVLMELMMNLTKSFNSFDLRISAAYNWKERGFFQNSDLELSSAVIAMNSSNSENVSFSRRVPSMEWRILLLSSSRALKSSSMFSSMTSILKHVSSFDVKKGHVTADEKIQKKNDVKARSMLLMALPNEHLMTFNQYKDAKSLFDAVTTRFGGNDATRKTQKTLLEQIYKNFIVWRNKSDLDKISIDDLYNNFKIIEQEVKRNTGPSLSSGSQNMAFVSTPSTSNNDDVSSVFRVSTDNLEQIHEDDLEEIDLKWQLALLNGAFCKRMQSAKEPVEQNPKSQNHKKDSKCGRHIFQSNVEFIDPMIEEIDEDENVNLVKSSKQGEAHETAGHRMESDDNEVVDFSTASPQKDDDEITLAETLVNIKKSAAKDTESEPPKKIKKKEMIQISLNEEIAQRFYDEEKAQLLMDEEYSQQVQAQWVSDEEDIKQLKQHSFEEIKMLFNRTLESIRKFVPMKSEDQIADSKAGEGSSKEGESLKRPIEEELGQEQQKKQKVKKDLSQERLQQMMVIILEQGIHVEALQTKYLIFDWEIYTEVSEHFLHTKPSIGKKFVFMLRNGLDFSEEIGFGSTIKLVSFDKGQVVTFNGKFVYGFRNNDCETKSQNDNTIGGPHGFIIHGIDIFKGNEEVTELIDVENWRIDNSRVLRWIVSLIVWNSSILSMKSSIQNTFRFG